MYICLHAYKYIHRVIMCRNVCVVLSSNVLMFFLITGDMKGCCSYVNSCESSVFNVNIICQHSLFHALQRPLSYSAMT